jgi:hypothetical protein
MTRCCQHLSQPQRSLLHISARPTRHVHILGLLLPQSRETCHGKDAGDGPYRREPGERAPSRPSPFCLTAPPSPARSSLSHRVPSDDAAFLPFPPGRGHRLRPSSSLAQTRVTCGSASSHFCIASTPSSHSRSRVNGNRRGTAGSTRPDLEIRGHRKRTIGVRIAMDNESDKRTNVLCHRKATILVLWSFSASLLGAGGEMCRLGNTCIDRYGRRRATRGPLTDNSRPQVPGPRPLYVEIS